MKLAVRDVNKIAILDPSGDVDLSSSPRLREDLLKQMQSGASSVLVNMTDVRYIDSSGIATLVEGLQLAKHHKKHFGLYGLRTNARSVLELARLDTVFTIFESEAEALEKIESSPVFGGV